MTARTTAKFHCWLHHAAFWSVIAGIATFAIIAGLLLRRYAWDQTEPARYTVDIDNAFRQGTQTLVTGYLDRYDNEQTQPEPQYMGLDYAPGRLAIARLWAGWVRKTVDHWDGDPHHLTPWRQQFYARARTLHRQYELVRPMLMVNLVGELLSALAMFLLVQRYAARGRPARGAILGLIAALFFWFDPALISNAHCWPQWDSWVLPFFLWAVLLASWNLWFCSGAMIAAGAMFKGQILFGAPLLILWPLFQERVPALTRWIVGLFSATATITGCWLLRVPGGTLKGAAFTPGYLNIGAIKWVIYLSLIFIALAGFLWKRQTRPINLGWSLFAVLMVQGLVAAKLSSRAADFIGLGLVGLLFIALWYYGARAKLLRFPVAALGIAILLIYPVHDLAPDWFSILIIATLSISLLIAVTPRKAIPFAAAGWIAGAMLLCIPIFGASKGWFDLGIAYGTHHYERMASGENNNLADLMREKWAWNDLMAPLISLPPGTFTTKFGEFLKNIDPGFQTGTSEPISLPLKYFLLAIWITAVVLSSLGAAIHDRNKSPRFLAALSAPWIMFFAVMAQMHQRYLLWGASLSSASVVLSPGYAVLHLFLSFVSWTQELRGMADHRFIPGNTSDSLAQTPLMQFVEHWHPGIAWAVLLTAVIYLYTAVKWTARE